MNIMKEKQKYFKNIINAQKLRNKNFDKIR